MSRSEKESTVAHGQDLSVFSHSVLLPERFSGNAALHLRYSSLSFSRATSILSPRPVISGRLRVLLLRQAFAIPLRTSFAVLQLWYNLTMMMRGCQLRFFTNRPCVRDGYFRYIDIFDEKAASRATRARPAVLKLCPYVMRLTAPGLLCPERPGPLRHSSSTDTTPSVTLMRSNSCSTLHFLFSRREKMAQAL